MSKPLSRSEPPKRKRYTKTKRQNKDTTSEEEDIDECFLISYVETSEFSVVNAAQIKINPDEKTGTVLYKGKKYLVLYIYVLAGYLIFNLIKNKNV